MRRALALAALLVCSFARALTPPNDVEMENQRRVLERYVERGYSRNELPKLMSLWFGRQFGIFCDFSRECVIHNYQLGTDGRIIDYHVVGKIPSE